MDFEDEITVEIDATLDDLISLVEKQGFILKEEYDLNDIYLINKDNKSGDYLTLLSKCVLLRDIILEDTEKKTMTYKYKEYNDKKEIVKQAKIDVNIDNIDKAKLLFESLNFEELIKINDHMLVYANDEDEFVIQSVNDKHIYIEIEDKCYYTGKVYKSVDEMKEVIKKCNIPIKGDDYFVKKAEIELEEKNAI